jgi:hypothetical protein
VRGGEKTLPGVWGTRHRIVCPLHGGHAVEPTAKQSGPVAVLVNNASDPEGRLRAAAGAGRLQHKISMKTTLKMSTWNQTFRVRVSFTRSSGTFT